MPIQKFDNFLAEDAYEEAIETANYLMSIGSNSFFTNRFWDYGIRKDSFPVIVHNIYPTSELHKKVKQTIEEKTEKIVVDGNIMIYYWTRFSYIPWHNDNSKYDGALTVYLNRQWDPDFGGYFLYEDGEEIKAVIPKTNMAVMQYGSLMHCTTPVNFEGDLRITLQTFLKNKENI